MIDFNSIKVVAWDFDDTLCIHKRHDNVTVSELEYRTGVTSNGKKWWNNSYKNETIEEFMKMCSKANMRQVLVSGCANSFVANAKVDWVQENYGVVLENFCVCSQKEKLMTLMAIAESMDLRYEEILIVDDYWMVLESLANEGFQAATPMEVVCYMNELKKGN